MSSYIGKRPRAPQAGTAKDANHPVPGKHTLVEQANPPVVPRRPDGAAAIGAAASRGIATPASPLPHGDLIQRAFGRHDVSDVQAHTGPEAAASASAMGARAYATGNHIVLGEQADLFTVAHEAAHVVQQRGGVHLPRGAGDAGDRYERQADQVASLVVQGQSAEELLDSASGRGAAVGAAQVVQRKEVTVDEHHGPGERSIHHVRYEVATAEALGPYEAATGGDAQRHFDLIVYLPSGFDPKLKDVICDKLGTTRILFTNEPHDRLETKLVLDSSPLDQSGLLLTPEKVTRARQIITQYLRSIGLDAIEESDVGRLIEAQPVGFYRSHAWSAFLAGIPGPGSDEGTEGLTKPGEIGKRDLGINEDNHTLNAVVHELFHSIESSALQGRIAHGLVEAITEYFTLHATGLVVRRAGDGGTVYAENVRFLRLAMSRGVVDHEGLVRGYFLGEIARLEVLDRAWRELCVLRTSVDLNGLVPIADQIRAAWASFERYLDGKQDREREARAFEATASERREGREEKEGRGKEKEREKETERGQEEREKGV